MKKIYFMKLLLLGLFVFANLVASAQTGSISGRVVDETKQPLPGASVSVKGTAISTSTDANGNFRLSNLKDGATTLIIRFIGYQSMEKNVNVTGDVRVEFDLRPSAESLNEIVVVGYGTQSRRELTGSIAKVDGARLASVPAPSFEAALVGKAPGVQVTQGSGLAGSASQVRIRGVGSVSGGGEPLYVIDGIPITSDLFSGAGANGDYRVRSGFNQNPLATIDPQDIASIEILKDAGAAGIYGSRGANGVILITTKRGKSGKPQFNFSSKVGIANEAFKPEFTNSAEWLQLRQEAWENDGNTGLAPLPGNISWAQAQQTDTDWWDLVTRTGFNQDYSLSVTTGGKKIKTYLGGSFSNNESFMLGNSYKRLSFRANIDYDITKNLSMNLSTSWAQGTNNRIAAGWAGGIGDAMSSALPIYPVYLDPATNNGNPYFYNGANPVRNIENTDWRTLDTRSITNLYFNYTPIKDLTIRIGGGFDYNDAKQDRFQSKFLMDGGNPVNGEAFRWPVWTNNYNLSATATYNFNPSEKHKFNFLAGTEYQRSQTRMYSSIQLYGADATNAFYRDPSLLDLANKFVPNNKVGVTGTQRLLAPGAEWAFASVFGRVNYTFNKKYVTQLTFRTDGSSRFGPNNKYGFFPSISSAWLASEEEFIKNISWISLLRVRAGYGITGNANIESDRWRLYYDRDPGTYGGQSIIYPTSLENPDLKWETTNNLDLALEFGVFNDRITGELAYYNKTSRDILLNANIPPSNGYNNRYANLGKIENQGFELSLNTRNIETKDFQWSTNFNIATNTNKVLDVANLPSEAISGGTNDTRVIVGYPVGTNFLVRFHKIDPADGLPIWLDKNGNLTKTYSLDDRVPVGKVTPDFFGGITNNFRYKNFDLSALFNFSYGLSLWDNSAKFQFQGASAGQNWVVRKDFLDRWTQPGDIAKYPKLYYDAANIYPGVGANYYFNSTMFLYDGSFIRLKELTLGYTLSSTQTKRLGISSARFYVTGTNLLTFTKYPGGDPEVARDYENATDRNMSPNVTYLTAPQQRTFILGVNVNF